MTFRLISSILVVCALFMPVKQVSAQSASTGTPPALLVADNIYITSDRTLVAEGGVEALQGNIRMQAGRITYNQSSGALTIEGPIRIDEGDGITVLADAAEMDKGLQNGLLAGARMVLDQQLQLASANMTRVGGRYTQLDKVAVTSCRICAEGDSPLWQIRARRVIHDQLEQQLYFEDAQFRIKNIPVFYFPRLRLPDPGLKRASGFLIPSIRTTSRLSTGVKVPYFIRLGDHADLTVSPYFSPKTRTLDLRYRQAFRRGDITFEGAYTRDDLMPGSRGYLFGSGAFFLGRNYVLTFGIQTVSDEAYLTDYGRPAYDRLQSEFALSRTSRDSYFRAGLIHYKTLRDSDDPTLQPSIVADARYERRFFPSLIGGEFRTAFQAHGHRRESDRDVLGRDIARATAELNWNRSWTFGSGLRADWSIGFAADVFDIKQDSNFMTRATRTTPRSALTFRYPMVRGTASGATHFLEPIVQLAWSNVMGDAVPNDESRFVEFDQGNLLALSHFPAPDRREDGIRLAYGLNWARFAPSGWEASASVGQILRRDADLNFTPTSGLSGTSSDFLLAGQLKFNNSVALSARTLFDEAFSFSKAELRGDWITKRSRLSGTYLWLGPDLQERRPAQVSEIWLDGSYDLSKHWSASADWRYDLTQTRPTSAGLGMIYRNECVEVDLSVRRTYTSSRTVEPSTDFGFTIALRGFSVAGGTERYRRSCS